MSKVLLTGACGYLGKHVCRHLHEQNVQVKATDLNRGCSLPVKIIVANLLDREKCYELVDDVSAVVHLANHPHDGARDPQTLYRENVSMTMNLVQAAVESGIKKVIYASSIQAMMFYFNHWHSDIRVSGCSIPYLPADGDMPANPGSSYGLSKQACEEMLRYFSKKHGLNSVALRFPWLVEEKWLSHIRSSTEREIPRCVNLDECMSFLSCADAARLIKAILDTDLTGFRIYLPASKDIKFHYPVPELVKELYPGVPLRKPVETLRSLVDISRITGETGWVPRDNLTADQ